jgi:hypothetical protein
MIRHIAIALTIVFVSSAAADAQGPAAPPSTGPLTLEPIHSPLTVAAQYKVTTIDGEVGHMAGVRAGRLVDDFLFIGGALYWLPDGRNRAELTYGGAVVGWSSSPRRRIRFGGEGLIGVGTAQLATDFTLLQRNIESRHSGRSVVITTSDGTRTIRTLVRDDFFVFEPQANLDTRLTNHFSLDLSAGYRVVGLNNALRDRLDGATGSFAVRFTF